MSASHHCRFFQVDVFTATPFAGNPVAVVLDADGIDAGTMQRIARWTNLSETIFVLAPTLRAADYRTRIFARYEELPFAGHPTLGAAHAVLESGLVSAASGRLRVECEAGLVDVAGDGPGDLSFRLPGHAVLDIRDAELVPQALGLPETMGAIELIDTGPRWVIAQVPAVESLTIDAAALRTVIAANSASGITVYANAGEGVAVRTFYFASELVEDPVCGSGNAAVAVHRLRCGAIADGSAYVARQGQQVGREGEVRVRIDAEGIHVGGHCITCVSGRLAVPIGA